MEPQLPLVELVHRERVIAELRSLLAALRVLLDEIGELPDDDDILPIKAALYRRMKTVHDHLQHVFDLHRVH